MSVLNIGTALRTYRTLESRNLERNEYIPPNTRIRIAIAALGDSNIERIIDSFDTDIEPLNGFAEVLSTYPEVQYESGEHDPIKQINSRIPWNVKNLGTMYSSQALTDIAGYVVAKGEGNDELQEIYKGRVIFDRILRPRDWKNAWKSFIDTN